VARKSDIIASIHYDTPYSAWIHNEVYKLGKRSIEYGPSSRKWLTKHLVADGPAFYKLVAKYIKSYMTADKILSKAAPTSGTEDFANIDNILDKL